MTFDLFSQIRDVINDVLDKRPQYGNGFDDITYAVDVMLTQPVYAGTITVAQGVLVTTESGSKVVLYAREQLTNHGTIRAGVDPTVGPGGVAFGDGTDADPGTTSTAGAGGSAGVGAYVGGQGQAPFTIADFPYRTEHQFFSFLDDATVPGGVPGGSGAGFGRTSGTGGQGGGFLGIVSPVVDNTDGVISVAGQVGEVGSSFDNTGIWTAATSYNTVGDDIVQPTTGNGHYYAVEVGGTSHATTEPTWPTDGSTVVDNTVTWRDLGAGSVVAAAAGGGGGGQGGIFAWFGRGWIGNQPIITGGAGGDPYNGDGAAPGTTGQDGYYIKLLDA